ncbi:MAG: hypothetical protein JXA92_10295 [candidate division Zixibacteria bacterium]|nr:hypothetical protein [candidate division Zixibacteria bacterium]
MKSYQKFTKLLILLLFFQALIFSGCNERTSNPSLTAEYQLSGALIADRNHDSTIVVIDLVKNDSTLTDADITFDDDSLVYNALNLSVDFVFSLTNTSLTRYLSSSRNIAVRDSSNFHDTVTVNVTDTFSILTIEPPNRLLPGGGPVALSWNGAANADGYILAAVLKDEVYTGQGYSAFSTSLNTADNIPTLAFTDGINTVFGWYYIYVYAYTGSPDSILAGEFLPTSLPGQLAANINVADLQGRFGSLVVTARDSVYVYAAAAR